MRFMRLLKAHLVVWGCGAVVIVFVLGDVYQLFCLLDYLLTYSSRDAAASAKPSVELSYTVHRKLAAATSGWEHCKDLFLYYSISQDSRFTGTTPYRRSIET